MKKLVASIIGSATLVGCGSTQITPEELALIQAQMQQQTLQIDCPSGCTVAYKDPRDKVTVPRRTNGWDAAIAVAGSAERVAGAAIVPGALVYQGVELGKAAVSALAGSGAVTTTTTTNTTTTTQTDIGDYSGQNSGSVGDYSGAQSGNTGEIITDNTGSIRSPIDNTSTPTVVEQPEPVVVTQPRPIIVPPGG